MERRKGTLKTKLRRRSRPRKEVVSIRDFLAKVEECVDAFDYGQAVKWCRRALRVAPNHVGALETMGALLLEMGRAEEAYESFQKAVKLRPDSGHAKYMSLGQMSSGREAVDYFRRGVDLMLKVADSATTDTVHSSSHKMADKDVNLAADISNAYCSMAEIYLTDLCFEENAEEECRRCCQKALEYGPSNPDAYQLMASFLISKEEMQEARSMLLRGTSLWMPCLSDGEDDEAKDDLEEMEECTSSASKSTSSGKDLLEPPVYHSRLNCAKLLMEVEEYRRAQLVLEGLLSEDNEVVSVWYLLGWLHYLTQEWLPAKDCLDRVVMLSSQLDCDEEDIISHAKELVGELTLKLQDVSNCNAEKEETVKYNNGERSRECEDEGDNDMELS